MAIASPGFELKHPYRMVRENKRIIKITIAYLSLKNLAFIAMVI